MIVKEFENYNEVYPSNGKILMINGTMLTFALMPKKYDISSITEVDDADYVPPEEIPEDTTDPLETLKKNQIKLSKNNLAKYLEEHPLFSTVKYAEGRYYNVTSEKQQQLTSKILMYQGYASMGLPYTLTWNDTGDVCEEWTFAELFTLSTQIDAYVTPLVKLQQTLEVEIKNAITQEDVLAVNIDFEEVVTDEIWQSN